MNAGYMGLVEPYEATWSNGLEVTIYPNGDVVDKRTGKLIRSEQKSEVISYRNNVSVDFNTLVLALVAIVAIVAICRK